MIAALAVPFAVHAQVQTGRITGTVTVAPGGQPLAGANVLIVGTDIRAGVSPEGRFTLPNVPAGTHQVRVQRIGYAPQTQTVVVAAGQTVSLTVSLTAQAVQLSEVVSVGYGTQSRRDVASAVTNVQLDAIQRAPIATIDQALQGTAPGVQVTTGSGEPGGALSIRVRGTSSITGNSEPLYVIDGFPIENDFDAASTGTGGRGSANVTGNNPLVSLNPSDIESISILKDASATAIYGARGANGVVIITTKQGRGTRPQFGVDAYVGQQSVAKTYDMLNAAEYMEYANAFGQGSSTPYTPFPAAVRDSILRSGVNTNWQDEIFRTAPVKNFQLSVRGATSAASPTRYNLSGGLFDQDGIVVGSGLSRLSTRLNINQALGARVEFGGSFSASQARSKAVPTAGQQNANAGAISAAIQYAPILPVRRADGTYTYIYDDVRALGAGATQLDPPQTPNPVSLAMEVRDSLRDTRLLGNVFAQGQVIPGLTARVSLGADYADRWRYTYYPRTTLRGQQANGEAIRVSNSNGSWINENTLTYQRQFGRHDVTVLGGYSRQRSDVDRENMSNSNFVSDITGYFDIGAGTQAGGPSVGSSRTTQTLESWLSRVNYVFGDRYIATLTYRTDGSSRFASGRKWGAFPSAALAWRVSSEPWFGRLRWVDDLKLRTAYGVVGNPSIRPYQSLASLSDQGYSFGGTPVSGYYPSAVGNPNLSWETTRELDVGLDLAFLDRFALTADYYTKKTTDLLLQVLLPSETGFSGALANRGSVTNRGFELGLDARLVGAERGDGFRWRANLNFATNRNEVLDLGGAGVPEVLITTDYNLPGQRVIVGKPIGTFYGFRSLGIIRDSAAAAKVTYTNFNGGRYQAGDVLVADIAGAKDTLSDGRIIDIPDGRITLDDRTDIGDPTPDFTAGLTSTFSWRRLELTGLLQGQFGGKVLNVNRIRTESSPRVNVSRERFIEAWSPTNPDGKFPAIGENPNQVGTNNFTSALLEDASFVRLRTLTLSYVLPPSALRVGNFSGARVYVTGANLLTLTDYSGFDPDVSGASVSNLNRGIDIGAYPTARTITIGASVNY
jgi:TonB-dependent starch-binding outer membrane protein SusC